MAVTFALVLALLLSLPSGLDGRIAGVGRWRTGQSSGSSVAVLAAARAALGGADSLAGVKGLQFQAEGQLISGGQVVSNDLVDVEFVVPGRYIRKLERSWPAVSERQGFDGDQFINEVRSRDAAITTGGRPPSDLDRPRLLRWVRETATAYLVACLLTDRTPLPVRYESRGRASSPDGEADVLEASTDDGFGVRVFLDAQTHRPLMAEYSEGIPTKAHAAMALYLSDYRRADGLWFPYQWRFTRGGQPNQVWTMTKVRVTR